MQIERVGRRKIAVGGGPVGIGEGGRTEEIGDGVLGTTFGKGTKPEKEGIISTHSMQMKIFFFFHLYIFSYLMSSYQGTIYKHIDFLNNKSNFTKL